MIIAFPGRLDSSNGSMLLLPLCPLLPYPLCNLVLVCPTTTTTTATTTGS